MPKQLSLYTCEHARMYAHCYICQKTCSVKPDIPFACNLSCEINRAYLSVALPDGAHKSANFSFEIAPHAFKLVGQL